MTTAVHYDALTAVQSVIQDLDLTDIADASIVVKKLPLERIKTLDAIDFPAILITPQNPTLNPTAGSNLQDDVVYGVLVTYLDADNQEKTLTANLARNLLWTELIRKAFYNKGLTAVATIYACLVEYLDPVLPQAWAANLYVSGLLLKFTSRETR